jgi:predicted enzyme related to lactoylglutathione lyase
MNDAFKRHCAFSWSELLVDNIESAIGFYTKVIGWEIEEMEMPQGKYYVLKSNGDPVGGIMAKPKDYGPIPDHWGTYITVDDVDETLAKAEAAGGKSVYPPMDVASYPSLRMKTKSSHNQVNGRMAYYWSSKANS